MRLYYLKVIIITFFYFILVLFIYAKGFKNKRKRFAFLYLVWNKWRLSCWELGCFVVIQSFRWWGYFKIGSLILHRQVCCFR